MKFDAGLYGLIIYSRPPRGGRGLKSMADSPPVIVPV